MLGSKINKQVEVPITVKPISKTVKFDDGSVVMGLDVETHCKIVGLVAKQLLSFYPDFILKNIFPAGADFIAACHDIGKISPDFQKMIYKNLSDCDINLFPEFASANAERAKRKENSFHAKVSQVTLEGIFENKVKYIPYIVGIHHGFNPNPFPCTEDSYGGGAWTKLRHLLFQHLEEYFLIPDKRWPIISSFEQATAVAGLVTVSDWIGSGGDFAKFVPQSDLTDAQLINLCREAVYNAGFQEPEIIKKLSFENIFGFSPVPIQKKFINSITEPGIYILEAPTGIGKTEAALYTAYTLLSQGKATGIYFALPTQLTSNKIYDRVNNFLLKICGSSNSNLKAKLLHSA